MSEVEQCPECGGSVTIRSIPAGCRGILGDDPATAAVCKTCLTVTPSPGVPVELGWDPGDVSDALPSNADAFVAVALLVNLLESIALNREDILTVVDYLETHGVDALLAIDRLSIDSSLSPQVDLDRRYHQLAQIIEQ